MSKARGKSARPNRRPVAPRAAPLGNSAPGRLPSGRLFDLLAHVVVPGLFFLLVWSWHPFHDVFEFDPDEGNNVIKALMLAKGHALYAEIWSDQPPLFTYLLRGWFALTNWTVHQGRLLVLLCSSVLVWSLYQTVRLSWGRAAALASVVLLAASYRYLAVSVVVMLAVPTLMFAMLSIYALARYRRNPHAAWMVASGVFLVLSLFTKMFALPVAPLIFLAALQAAWSGRADAERKGRWLRPLLLWCAGFVLGGAVLFLCTISLHDLMQLVQPHLDAKEKLGGRLKEQYDTIFWEMCKADYAFALLGLCGLLQILRKRDWFSMLPVVWCVLAYLSLWTHRPLWYHHYPLLAVPLCWTAGIAFGPLCSRDLWRSWLPFRGSASVLSLITLALTVGFGGMAVSRIPDKFKRERDYAKPYTRLTPHDEYTVAVLRQFKDRTDYMVTDRQMLAFSAGMIVPPELSVTSVKRMRSGHLSIETLIGLLEEYEPGVIHLSWRKRIPMTRELSSYLKAHYRRLYADPRGDRCYVHNARAGDLLPVLQRAADATLGSSEGHYNLGVQLARAGRHEDAVRSFESSLAIRRTVDAYRGLGKSLKRLGRHQRAAKVYETLARSLKRMGRDDEAARDGDEAKRLRELGGRSPR